MRAKARTASGISVHSGPKTVQLLCGTTATSGTRTRQFNTGNTKARHLHDPEPATSTSRLHILLPRYPSSHSVFQELCRPILFAHFLYPMLATCPAHHFVFFYHRLPTHYLRKCVYSHGCAKAMTRSVRAW